MKYLGASAGFRRLSDGMICRASSRRGKAGKYIRDRYLAHLTRMCTYSFITQGQLCQVHEVGLCHTVPGICIVLAQESHSSLKAIATLRLDLAQYLHIVNLRKASEIASTEAASKVLPRPEPCHTISKVKPGIGSRVHRTKLLLKALNCPPALAINFSAKGSCLISE